MSYGWTSTQPCALQYWCNVSIRSWKLSAKDRSRSFGWWSGAALADGAFGGKWTQRHCVHTFSVKEAMGRGACMLKTFIRRGLAALGLVAISTAAATPAVSRTA